MVKKGEYKFEILPKIYCIGILAESIFTEIEEYHNISTIRNRKNEIIDDQTTFVTVELDKFATQLEDIKVDLDKLIYTMKTLHTVTDPAQFPTFWNEKWLKKAINEVDLRAMTPDQKMAYEMVLSANALVLKNESKKIEDAKNRQKEKFVTSLLQQTDFDPKKVAIIADVSVEFIEKIQQKLSAKN